MSYEVDVGGLGPITIAVDDPNNPGQNDLTVGLVWPGEIASFQWYRLSLSLNPSAEQNPPGTLLKIISEFYGIQGDGQQFTTFTVRNLSNTDSPFQASVFTLNVVSTPSHQ
jgi:hypothetical protein